MKEIDLKRDYQGSPWVYYLSKVKCCINKYGPKSVLKTDSHNEARGKPIPGGMAGQISPMVGALVLLEIDGNVLRKAKQNLSTLCPNLANISYLKGDIRNLRFYSQSYDMVIDLSTLDHVSQEDLDVALYGYNLCLKKDGILLLVVWCSKSGEQEEDNRSNQYLFSKLFLDDILSKYFTKEEEEEFFDYYYYPNGFMCGYVLKKIEGVS